MSMTPRQRRIHRAAIEKVAAAPRKSWLGKFMPMTSVQSAWVKSLLSLWGECYGGKTSEETMLESSCFWSRIRTEEWSDTQAKRITETLNGTMASANIPGWWRVSVSNSDSVADFPTYPDGSKLYSYGYMFVEKIGEVWFQHYYAHMGANAKRQDWGTEPNTSRPWIIDYNTANKPSAGDVGALPITGGRLNGSLGIGTDNALGGNSIVLGDNDTGIKWHSDGVLGLYANNALVGYIDNSGLHMSVDVLTNGILRAGNGKTLTLSSGNNSAMNAGFSLWGNGTDRPTVIELSDDQGWHFYSQRRQDGGIELSVNGNIYPANYSNFDARYLTSGNVYTKGESDNRYVQNIQRGAPVWPGKVDEYGPAEAPAGCFLTQARHDPTTAYGVTFAYRPLQMWVGNGWRTING